MKYWFENKFENKKAALTFIADRVNKALADTILDFCEKTHESAISCKKAEEVAGVYLAPFNKDKTHWMAGVELKALDASFMQRSKLSQKGLRVDFSDAGAAEAKTRAVWRAEVEGAKKAKHFAEKIYTGMSISRGQELAVEHC